jgi:hypothetical protein
MRKVKLAGFDMGRNYVAWAVVRGSFDHGFSLYRHGLLYPPALGSTKAFGQSLKMWEWFFWMFIEKDLMPLATATERFTYRRGGGGQGAEDINLRLPAMTGPSSFLVRNVEWKSWFHKQVHAKKDGGARAYFGTPTDHEADAAGIALYLGTVILPGMISAKSRVQKDNLN